MNNLKFKRFTAYLIDLLIVSVLVTLLIQINFLTPHKNQYEETQSEYQKFYEENFSDISELSLSDLTSSSYSNIIQKMYYSSMDYTLIEIGVIVLYFTLSGFLYKGQTIGKKMCKIKIVNIDDKKANIIQLLVRSIIYPIWTSLLLYCCFSNGLYLLSSILFEGKMFLYIVVSLFAIFNIYCYADLIVLLIRKDGRALHDIITKTKVISTESQQLIA